MSTKPNPLARWEIVAQFDDGYITSVSLPRHWFRFMAQQKADLGNAIASPQFKAKFIVRKVTR